MTKLLSKEMDSAVMALSQLNRQCEFREDKRPILSDIRESGSIEQDADTIAFIFREHVYDASVPQEDAELIIRKQRCGPIGTVKLRFNPRTVHFDDRPPPAPPPKDPLELP
jgi:replicative DNA helicase